MCKYNLGCGAVPHLVHLTFSYHHAHSRPFLLPLRTSEFIENCPKANLGNTQGLLESLPGVELTAVRGPGLPEAGQLQAAFSALGECGNAHSARRLCANYTPLKGSLNACSQSSRIFFVQKNTFVIKLLLLVSVCLSVFCRCGETPWPQQLFLIKESIF